MKHLLFLFIFCTLSLLAQPVIILPDKASQLEKTAAQELALHLEMVCGRKISVANEKISTASAGKIYIGQTAFARKNGIDSSKFNKEEHFVKAFGKNALVITGGIPRGILYGVYEFLEHRYNFLWPDEWNTHCDKAENITWSDALYLNGKPAIPRRSVYSSFREGGELWKIRNRQNAFHVALPEKFDGYGITTVFGAPWFCHTFYEYTKDLPADKHDILSLNSGKRRVSTSRRGMGQICYSNPETSRYFAEKLLKWIPLDRKGKEKWQYPEFYVLATNDNRNECECKNCLAVARTAGYSALKTAFVNQVAQIVHKTYPEIIFQTDAYGLHAFPAKNDVKPGKNVSMLIAYGALDPARPRDHFKPYSHPVNKLTKKIHEDWAKQCQIAVWDYWTDFIRPNYPSTNLPAMAENIRFYHKLGTIYLMGECPGVSRVSLWRLRVWFANRLMVDPYRDPDTEIKRFMAKYYGKAASAMFQYQKLLERSTAKLKDSICTYTLDRRHDLDKAFFAEAEKILNEAKKAAGHDALILERIEEERVVVAEAKIEKFNISDPDFVNTWHKSMLKKLNKNESAWHISKQKTRIDQFRDAALANIPPPAGFEKQTIIADYPWTKLILARYNRKVSDPEAAGGFAVVPGFLKEAPEQYKGVAMGIYDQQRRTYVLPHVLLPRAAAPADEKYHWYDLGRCRLPASPLLYLHSSWRLQLMPSDAHRSPEIYDNDVRVYVSLKLQGPTDVPNSRKPDMYAVDRVLIVRGDLTSQLFLSPLPAGITPQQTEADLSGSSLKVKKLSIDKSSLTGFSTVCGSAGKNSSFVTTFTDNTNSIKKVNRKHALKRDGRYHLIKVYEGVLTRDCVLSAGKIKLDLGPCFAMNRAEEKYNIYLSVKLSSDNIVRMDRCLILKNK